MVQSFERIRVLDLSGGQALITGNMLGKLGADVVLVEPTGGSPTRRYRAREGQDGFLWQALATARRGITCNLAGSKGRTLLARLAETADIIVTGGDLTGADTPVDVVKLRAANPRLIHVSITPFGEDGPKSGYAATDLIVWASSGALFPSRDGDRPPLRISSDQAMLHAGADAAIGALAALFAREKTGRGQGVTVSAQESAAQATLSSVLATEVGHENFSFIPAAPKIAAPKGEKVLDLSGSGSRTRRSKWRVKDGMVEMHLAMGPAAGRFTNNLFAWLRSIDACTSEMAEWDWAKQVPAALETGELCEDDIEVARDRVAAALASHTKAELLEVAIRNKLVLAPVMTIGDLAYSPQMEARHVFVDAAGNAEYTRVPAALTGKIEAVSSLRAAPKQGEHNEEIYAEIGLGGEELAALRSEGVI